MREKPEAAVSHSSSARSIVSWSMGFGVCQPISETRRTALSHAIGRKSAETELEGETRRRETSGLPCRSGTANGRAVAITRAMPDGPSKRM